MNCIAYDDFGFPIATDAGIRCGNHPTADIVRHANVAAVRECYRRWQELHDQVEADHQAEVSVERALEGRGYWDARAQEDHEAALGVIPFDIARRDALAHA